MQNFRGTLKNRKNHESLAQRIFPHLRNRLYLNSYVVHWDDFIHLLYNRKLLQLNILKGTTQW